MCVCVNFILTPKRNFFRFLTVREALLLRCRLSQRKRFLDNLANRAESHLPSLTVTVSFIPLLSLTMTVSFIPLLSITVTVSFIPLPSLTVTVSLIPCPPLTLTVSLIPLPLLK